MKKILVAIIISLSIITTSSAETWDIQYVAKWNDCHKIKYSCSIWWSFYGDNIGCGCQQILLDSQMQKADILIKNLVSKIHTLYPNRQNQQRVLTEVKMQIKNKVYENKKNEKIQVLGWYLLRKIYEMHGNEF